MYRYGGTTNQSDGCQCSLSSICTSPAGLFVDVNYTTNFQFSKEMYNGLIPAIMISGWKGGCYPVESLLLSTLECFYNLTCLNLIISNDKEIQPLDKQPSSINVRDILKELFINEWNSTISYENYIKECAPKFCTYFHTQRTNLIEIITMIFGLIGGLTIALELFVGQIILRLFIFITMRRRRRQVIPSNVTISVQQGKVLSRKKKQTKFLFVYS